MDWCHKRTFSRRCPSTKTSDDNCPYNAISSLAIDPAKLCAISSRVLPDLSRQSLKPNRPAPICLRNLRRGQVNYAKVKALERALLHAAFDTFRHTRQVRSPHNPAPAAAARFPWRTMRSGLRSSRRFFGVFNGGEWQPAPHGTAAAPRIRLRPSARALGCVCPKTARALARRQLFHVRAMAGLRPMAGARKSYGDRKQVWLMGDMPFGAAMQRQRGPTAPFLEPGIRAVTPPEKFFKADAFHRKMGGQNWGVPDYRWDELRGGISTGGARAQARFKRPFTSAALIMRRVSFVFTRFRGRRTATRNASASWTNPGGGADGGRLPGLDHFPTAQSSTRPPI